MYKLLQLNIEGGGLYRTGFATELCLLPAIVAHIKKERYDLITMQELGVNSLALDKDVEFDCFAYLLKELPEYQGELFKTMEFTDNAKAYHGIAAFYNANFHLTEVERIFTNQVPKQSLDFNWKNGPYGAIRLKLQEKHQNKSFHLISGHFSVGPIDFIESRQQIERAHTLVEAIRNLNDPIILAGDFNVNWAMKTVRQFESLNLRNLARENQITNTINPKRTIHYENIFVKDPVSSKRGGVACDNILISRDTITLKDFDIVTADISDHFGLKLEFEFPQNT